MKITAAVLDTIGLPAPYADTRPLRLASLDLADPGPGELLVRIDAAGLCHSDLSVVNGDRARPTPMALGHEAAASVIRTGDGVTGFSAGDRVVLAFLPACGQCAECGAGRGYLCPHGAAANGAGRMLRGGHRLQDGDRIVFHHMGVSAFATHAVIDQRSAVKIPSDIPPQIAALFGCAVLTGVGAVFNTAQVRPGKSVAVYGLGGVGLSAVLGALAAGANPVIAIDPVEAKRALALELGASAAAAPEQAIDAIGAGGADVVIETAGKAAVLAAAYRATKRGGRTVDGGPSQPGGHAVHSGRVAGGRRQDADGQLYGLLDSRARHSPLHRAVAGGTVARAPPADLHQPAVRHQHAARRARQRRRDPSDRIAVMPAVRLSRRNCVAGRAFAGPGLRRPAGTKPMRSEDAFFTDRNIAAAVS